jgi:hypothetical protein
MLPRCPLPRDICCGWSGGSHSLCLTKLARELSELDVGVIQLADELGASMVAEE